MGEGHFQSVFVFSKTQRILILCRNNTIYSHSAQKCDKYHPPIITGGESKDSAAVGKWQTCSPLFHKGWKIHMQNQRVPLKLISRMQMPSKPEEEKKKQKWQTWRRNTDAEKAVRGHNNPEWTYRERQQDEMIFHILLSPTTELKLEETRILSSCPCQLWIRRDYCCQSMPPTDQHSHSCHNPNLLLTKCVIMCHSTCGYATLFLSVLLSARAQSTFLEEKKCLWTPYRHWVNDNS